MAGTCDICGKGPQFGHNVSHSNRKTNRMWHPNTHKATIQVSGAARRVTACTRCLRTISKSRA
jgi:large subunit ribosomal protein L28